MFKDEQGLQMRTRDGITSTCEQLRLEQYHDPLQRQPLKTMIRSLDTLNPQNQNNKASNFSKTTEEVFMGWGPQVKILQENDLKKIEKAEDRDARIEKRKRRTR